MCCVFVELFAFANYILPLLDYEDCVVVSQRTKRERARVDGYGEGWADRTKHTLVLS
jgi:hypothetical protein